MNIQPGKISSVAQYKDVPSLRARLEALNASLPVDDRILSAAAGSPLAAPLRVGTFEVGNRWCIHPMEGWDGQRDGNPSDHTLRRWQNFGRSGAKLIWGGEAAAVRHDGRANPRQIMATAAHRSGLRQLHDATVAAHRAAGGNTDDLLIGLQLTHSGRFARPNDARRAEPRIAWHHPLLDEKFVIDPQDDSIVWKDDELPGLIDDYVAAAHAAYEAGFRFVDIKACHGYLLHEFLSGRRRSGRNGGDLAGRSRLLLTIIERIRQELPTLLIGVRLSVFDSVPYQSGREIGRPMRYEHLLPYDYGFGVNPQSPLEADFTEPLALVETLQAAGVTLLNITCGSPYYNPHLQRPAFFPPSDGYQPPEDPLMGVARQIEAARLFKQRFPTLPMVGSGYTYLQDFLPHVAQAVVRAGWIDFVGLGRMVLSYPELPAETLAIGQMSRKKVCRTFSDCTTAPRQGMISGCYPLDSYYKQLPEAQLLKAFKKA